MGPKNNLEAISYNKARPSGYMHYLASATGPLLIFYGAKPVCSACGYGYLTCRIFFANLRLVD